MAGNQGNNRIVWTKKQLAFLHANWQTMTAQELSDALGIKRTKVREKKYELGLFNLELEFWTAEQVRFLKANYKKYGDSELAEMFAKKWKKKKGWSKKHIEKKRRYLGLKRTAKQIRDIHERNVIMGRFALCPVKAWAKRGVTPVGTLKVWKGEEGKPLVFIKTKSGYTPYARWFYRHNIGRIPAGKVVRIKDGNQLNITPENLILVSRKENAVLNSKLRVPKEYLETNRLIKKLNQILSNHEEQSVRPQ